MLINVYCPFNYTNKYNNHYHWLWMTEGSHSFVHLFPLTSSNPFSPWWVLHVPHDTWVFLLLCHHAQCVLRRVSIILSTLTGVDTITETPLWTLRSTTWRSPVQLVDSTSEQEVNRSHDHRMCFIPHRLQCLSLFLPVSVNKAWIQTSL